MDPSAHKRFLEYRETFIYYHAGRTILDRESWLALDAELEALNARGEKSWTLEDARRARALRRLLLID